MSSVTEERVVIYDHLRGYYWRENSCGYTASAADAGRYSRSEGEEIVRAHAKNRKLELRGIEQGAPVARPQSAPARPVAAQAAVKAHKAGAAQPYGPTKEER